MEKCSYCSKELPEQAVFCPNCGKVIQGSEYRIETNSDRTRLVDTCNECGRVLPKFSNFCPFCGSMQGATKSPTPEVTMSEEQYSGNCSKKETRSSSCRTIIAFICYLVGLICILFFISIAFITTRSKDPSQTSILSLFKGTFESNEEKRNKLWDEYFVKQDHYVFKTNLTIGSGMLEKEIYFALLQPSRRIDNGSGYITLVGKAVYFGSKDDDLNSITLESFHDYEIYNNTLRIYNGRKVGGVVDKECLFELEGLERGDIHFTGTSPNYRGDNASYQQSGLILCERYLQFIRARIETNGTYKDRMVFY